MRSKASFILSPPSAAGIEIDEGLLVEVVAEREHDGVEDRRILPGLAAMGDRGDALRLEVVEQ